MARYIDADNFRKTMIKRFGCIPCLTDYSEFSRNDIAIDDALNLVHTADVAPRAEVAREIFEEIEKIIEKHHSECYEYEDGDECDTAITYLSYLSVDIDDLKKKYNLRK